MSAVRPRSHCPWGAGRDSVQHVPRRPSLLLVVVVVVLGLGLVGPGVGVATAKGGDGDRAETRVSGRCSGTGTAQLRLRARDGAIRLDFDARRVSTRARWRVVVVQERRVVARLTVRPSSSGLSVRRTLRDLPGSDAISVRATGPGGASCTAAATLAGTTD